MSVDGSEALARITLAALEDDEFRVAWDLAVRDTADYLCARVTGSRMAGEQGGAVYFESVIPAPEDMDEADVNTAFRHAVKAEVEKRLNAMEK